MLLTVTKREEILEGWANISALCDLGSNILTPQQVTCVVRRHTRGRESGNGSGLYY